MNALANISVSGARLPAAYEAAKTALANCDNLDECQNWADKAAALASYAKQAADEELMKRAVRIRDRAIRRAGELLKQFDARPHNSKQSAGGDTLLSQREAAEQAGMSKRQQVTAVRVANVPASDFEALVESHEPPTVTALAKMGTTPRPVLDLKGRDPREFNRSLHFIASVAEYAATITSTDFGLVLPGLVEAEAAKVRQAIARIDAAHDTIVARI